MVDTQYQAKAVLGVGEGEGKIFLILASYLPKFQPSTATGTSKSVFLNVDGVKLKKLNRANFERSITQPNISM